MEQNALRITVPAGVELVLKTKFRDGEVIAPVQMQLMGKQTSYLFKDLPVGDYSYEGTGEGYFSRSKALYFSEEKAKTGLDLFFDPGKKTGKGFEPVETVCGYNDEVLEKVIPSDPSLWENYRDIFTTPAFAAHKELDRITTQEELMAYLREKATAENNGYLFILCQTEGYGLEMPLVIFTKTDLRGVKTLEEAAEKMRANHRLTVHYQAQIHGNEPAAGEGALAVIGALAGKRGKAWLEAMDICVIPRVNPDGTRAFTRNEVAKKINLNRDFILCESVEARAIQHCYQLFQPEVFIDGHEYTKKPEAVTSTFDDLMLGVADGINNSKESGNLNLAMMKEAFEAANREGLRITTYTDAQYKTKLCIANAVNPSTGRLYFALLGSLTLLIETRGIHAGKEAFHRRVVGQFITVESALNFSLAHAKEIVEAVREERGRICEAGKVYDPFRKFVLTTDISKDEELAIKITRPRYSLESGECIQPDATTKLYFYDVALRTRPFPTAYVLPKGKAWEGTVIDILTHNGIQYREIEAGGSAVLRQYIGSAQRAFLLEEKKVTFPKGAYVLPMAQVTGLVLATLLEPDCTDAGDGKGSLVQGDIIPATAGVFPIYRYTRDLPVGALPVSED